MWQQWAPTMVCAVATLCGVFRGGGGGAEVGTIYTAVQIKPTAILGPDDPEGGDMNICLGFDSRQSYNASSSATIHCGIHGRSQISIYIWLWTLI